MAAALERRPDVIVSEADSDRAVLVIHGMGGSKADAEDFADRAGRHGWQTVSVDLPQSYQPWDCVPFVQEAYSTMGQRWERIALRATSIGAWFGTTALHGKPLARAMLQSPVLDMVAMVHGMMSAVDVGRGDLEAAGELPGPNGTTLSWPYLRWAESHVVMEWSVPTSIIVGDRDELLPTGSVEAFANRFRADLTIVPGGGHWLHLPSELSALAEWEATWLNNS